MKTFDFTIYKNFEIELDGEFVQEAETLEEAHAVIRKMINDEGLTSVAITEAFGRNRQYIHGPRGGIKVYKP
jgi:hypothetical protein